MAHYDSKSTSKGHANKNIYILMTTSPKTSPQEQYEKVEWLTDFVPIPLGGIGEAVQNCCAKSCHSLIGISNRIQSKTTGTKSKTSLLMLQIPLHHGITFKPNSKLVPDIQSLQFTISKNQWNYSSTMSHQSLTIIYVIHLWLDFDATLYYFIVTKFHV